MALLRSKPGDIPKDAVVLTEAEAYEYQCQTYETWPKFWDVFGIRYGPIVLSLASTFTGLYFNSHYRMKFKLFQHGRIASYLPATLVPCCLSMLTHSEFVHKDIVLMKRNVCPLCLEIRSACMQVTTGCILPFFTSLLGATTLAHRFATYNVPYPIQQPKQTLEMFSKMTRPIKNVVFAIFVGHLLLGAAITQLEAKSVFTVNARMVEFEKNHEELGNY